MLHDYAKTRTNAFSLRGNSVDEAEKRLLFFCLCASQHPQQAVEMECDMGADVITWASQDV
jgi:hypothetical protein